MNLLRAEICPQCLVQAPAMNDLSELSAPLPVPAATAQSANSLNQAGEGRRKKKITRRVGYAREPSEEGPPASAKAVGGSNAIRPQQPAASPATAVGAPARAVPQAAPAVGQRELPTPAHALVAAGGAFLMPSDITKHATHGPVRAGALSCCSTSRSTNLTFELFCQ